MNTRISVAVTDCMAAIALSVPPVAFATKGGAPHSTKPCPTHRQSGKHNGSGKGARSTARAKATSAVRSDLCAQGGPPSGVLARSWQRSDAARR